MKKLSTLLLSAVLTLSLAGCQIAQENTSDTEYTELQTSDASYTESQTIETTTSLENETEVSEADAMNAEEIIVPENFVLINGGTFEMGSPESEDWRSTDETQHSVTVSDFYMSIYEVTQEEYTSVMGANPSTFSGNNLPVENMTWYDAVAFCNAKSEAEGLIPAYTIDGENVTWDRSANGYRLPTEAEWEYACRAGTTTPFNTENSPSADEVNYYGHYPYEIEGNYFSQGNLETQPGIYRETTVEVGSFLPNNFGLYDMHGNVSEWCWDIYGTYDTNAVTNPTGAVTGNLRVTRGGGWNDFAKNMRSAYRATTTADGSSYNLGIRLVRGIIGAGTITVLNGSDSTSSGSNVLIAYFSWGGNTKGIAEQIAEKTGADLFEIELVNPYSSDYNTVLDEAQRDQNEQARPELSTHVEDMSQYNTIMLGYPNWWASIPMPIASFLEEYDFSGKTILPFCSHGGGRFGQSLTAIAKLTPDSTLGEGLSVHYSGGSSLEEDIDEWLELNNITQN